MNPDDLFRRYQELQSYVGWVPEDAARVKSAAPVLQAHFVDLVNDFYAEIEKHPDARKVITGGAAQIERLKGTLRLWLAELVSGQYDRDYVTRRWRVGWRHVEIGLDQVYTNVALSRLRTGLVRVLQDFWTGDADARRHTVRSLNKLIDLDLAIIEDAYRAEYSERLQRSERLAAIGQIGEAAPCLIVILRPDHTVAYCSRFAEEATGFTAQAIRGGNFAQLFLPAESQTIFAKSFASTLLGQATAAFESQILAGSGARRWMIWNVRLLPDYEGGPAVLAVGQDTTAIKDAQDKSLQAERLAAIGQMVTGLAHESGNALARSRACLEMLALEVEDRPEALNLIDRIQKAQDHLEQLYEEVRNYASPLKLEPETWNVATIWRQAWHNLALKRQGRDTHLQENIDGINLSCSVDQFRLEQVFRNVLDNSLAACPNSVHVRVHCAEVNLDGRPALRISVCDNGPGLSPEQKSRIFDPFFTTKTKGTGLGMPICKRIIDAHGGKIGVGNGTEGAEIVITLPRETAAGA